MRHELEQGTEEWLNFRKSHCMASEAPAVLEENPWFPMTQLQLWELKTGLKVVEVNEAMRRGSELEPRARKALEQAKGKKFPPCVVTREIDGIPLGASLDGFNKVVLEIKIPKLGEKSQLWLRLMDGLSLPMQYQIQCQQQLLVTEAKELWFWVYDPISNKGIIQTILPDEKLQKKIIKGWKKFYPYLEKGKAPPASKKDFVTRKDSEWLSTAKRWAVLNKKIAALAGEESILRDSLIALADDQSCEGGGIRFKRRVSKGRVSYTKIPELDGVDLEKYRSKSFVQYYITRK